MSFIFTCKQASRHLSKEDYEKLRPLEKFSLKLHVFICPVCGAYNRQVMKFQDMVRTFRERKERELESDAHDTPRLDSEKREKIKAAMKAAVENDTP